MPAATLTAASAADSTAEPIRTAPGVTHVRAAWAIGVCADLLQLLVFPLFGEGFASPANDALDLAVAVALTFLIGFHWSYVPSFLLESLPFVDAAPTWTGSVMLATRALKKKQV